MVRLIKFVCLPNILLNKSIVPEFLQDNLSAEIIANKTLEIINDKKYLNSIRTYFTLLHKSLKRETSKLIYQKLKPYLI